MKKLVIFIIRIWQATLSPDHGLISQGAGRCRFYPSCSKYAEEAFRQYGLGRGFMFSLKRLFRCHPFSIGGYDPLK